jgi:hypothetical protein
MPGELRETEISVNVIQRDVDGKTFCYEPGISLVQIGNEIGVVITDAFFNEDGKGVYQTRELQGP